MLWVLEAIWAVLTASWLVLVWKTWVRDTQGGALRVGLGLNCLLDTTEDVQTREEWK